MFYQFPFRVFLFVLGSPITSVQYPEKRTSFSRFEFVVPCAGPPWDGGWGAEGIGRQGPSSQAAVVSFVHVE